MLHRLPPRAAERTIGPWPNPTRLRRRSIRTRTNRRPSRSCGSSPPPPTTRSSSPTSTRGSGSGTPLPSGCTGSAPDDAIGRDIYRADRRHDRRRGRRPELAAARDRPGHRRLARAGHRATEDRPRGRSGGRRRDRPQPARRRARARSAGVLNIKRDITAVVPARARAGDARQPGHRDRSGAVASEIAQAAIDLLCTATGAAVRR